MKKKPEQDRGKKPSKTERKKIHRKKKQRKRKQKNPEKPKLTSLSPQSPLQIRKRKNPSSKP
jgi:hypothetical protein